MSVPLIVWVPLLVLGLVLLFPFMGCVGDDPGYVAGQQDQAKQDAAKQAAATQQAAANAASQQAARAYEAIVAADSHLVSYWRLSEGEDGTTAAKDSAADQPQDGEYKNAGGGGVQRSVAGVLSLVNEPTDKAAQFDGTQGYVEVPHSVVLNPSLEFTVEAWIRPTTPIAPTPQVVVSAYEMDATGAVTSGFVLDIYQNAAMEEVARVRMGDGTTFTSIEASVGDGSEHDGWRHLVATYDITLKALMLYINADNALPDAQTTTGHVFYLANQSSPFRIAAGQTEQPTPSSAPASFFNGRIDEVALYRAALDGATIKDHFLSAVTAIS